MTNEWRRSVEVPMAILYKKKEDMKSCNNYHGIKLMSHTETMRENNGAKT